MYVLQFSHNGEDWYDQSTFEPPDFYYAKESLQLILDYRGAVTKNVLFSKFEPDELNEPVVFWRLVGRTDKAIID
jgi:hypothetical protein